ncbi:hypothetical protein LMH77_09125, partial [Vibrio lentus]
INIMKKSENIFKKIYNTYKSTLFKGIDLSIPNQSSAKRSHLVDALTAFGLLLALFYAGLVIYRGAVIFNDILGAGGTIIWALVVLALSISTLIDNNIMAKKGYDRFYKRFFFKSLLTVAFGAISSYYSWQAMLGA